AARRRLRAHAIHATHSNAEAHLSVAVYLQVQLTTQFLRPLGLLRSGPGDWRRSLSPSPCIRKALSASQKILHHLPAEHAAKQGCRKHRAVSARVDAQPGQ